MNRTTVHINKIKDRQMTNKKTGEQFTAKILCTDKGFFTYTAETDGAELPEQMSDVVVTYWTNGIFNNVKKIESATEFDSKELTQLKLDTIVSELAALRKQINYLQEKLSPPTEPLPF